ncbi:ABC transporter permease [Isoptericola halotolerans]|uniref:ABC-2 type transport system permease protein n=1 Tax=Isoptericola halotolerans TaxID=300560 RepID=A0ABX2A3E9_9MICO|nr:ABC transporter permease [Isoptericola halotolerans]NOV97221.1 ABC-2 type transport system permease protein [Isoptericola halotolerans]
MLPIAQNELVQLFRNRAVLVTSLLMPVAVAAFFISYRDTFTRIGSLGYVAAVLVFTIAAFSLYATTVTTLAARRQTLFLKRLRSTAASDVSVLAGLVLPVSIIAVVQIGLILGVFAAVGGGPSDAVLLVAAAVAIFAMMLALGIATAGVTNSPEHAQITALPLSLGVIAVATWVGITGTESLTMLKRVLPGGAATELVVNAWNGGAPLTDSLLLLGPTLGWVAVSVVVAQRMFRWEPRR